MLKKENIVCVCGGGEGESEEALNGSEATCRFKFNF